MADYFLDTSALIKRHVNETGSGWVRSLTGSQAAHTIYIARVTAVEICSAITRRQRGPHLSALQASSILGHFRRHLAQRYHNPGTHSGRLHGRNVGRPVNTDYEPTTPYN